MPLPRYTLRQLDAFITAADTLSFTDAGNRLGLTPSAVSQLVGELEAAVGFKLFDRSTRKVALSSAGKEFLASVEMVLRHVQLAETAASDLRNRSAGLVRVAAPMVIASVILPKIIKAYKQTYPKVMVRIRDAAVERLADMVASGEVDLAIGPDRSSGDDVKRTGLFESPWVLWCSAEHPLARKRVLHWNDLRNQALVAAGRDHERSIEHMHVSLPDDERIAPIDVVDNISTALGIAAEGLAVTLSPAYVGAWAKRMGLSMRRIIEPEVMRQVCLYQPTRRVNSPAAEGFAAYLANWSEYGIGAYVIR
ncbi:LysR family transcriptional regulator [Undibacterium sp. TS12]|uniref:LysR family transcriptional regulator n=1 Tax=Undibacterium sp. TS12 TaxID=2908202 RepID=UPI001F4CAE9D|nr:LysR family transcriptional regulator [Undibacterium sp. TS12]MCH8622980.1 LysR substrate-binding domain-containing protein [Undibacterium sp. TS12]